jgi:hypothetical protein
MKTELEFLKYIKSEIQSAKNGEGISFNLRFIVKDVDERIKEIDAVTKKGQETLKEMKEFMETLKDFDTWKEWKNTDPIEPVQQAEWDDSHELNNVMNNIVDEVFPEFTLSKSVFDKLSDLPREHWKQIDWETNEYLKITYETQFIVPLDSGNSLHCHHADYDVNGTIYRLTWTIGGAANEQPIMERKIN